MIFNRATIIKLTLFVVLLSNLVLKSQTIVTIGSNTTTVNSEKYPFNGYYDFGWSSQIYLSSEVAGSGTITAVSFSVTSSPVNYTMTAQKIYVRHTSASSYTSSTYPGVSGFTLVYDGNIVYNGNGWKSISFSTPFIYDGTSNLEFLFENRDGSYTSGFPYFAYTTNTGSNRLKRDYKDGSFPSTCTNCSAINNILNIQIAKVCTSFPIVSVSSTNSIVCNNNAINLIANGASSYSWTPSVGLNLTTGATVTANPSSNTIYTVTGTTSGCSAIATITVTVDNLNTGTAIAAGSGNRCSNGLVTLSLDSKSSLSIGTGTLNTEKYPFNGYYNFSWSDVIYTQSELGASGTISKIAFYVDNAPSAYTMNNQLIYIRNTSAQSFTNTSYPGTSGFTQVFNGTITYNGSGWKEITFNTPYNYNGIDNLEVLFENRDASFSSGFPTFRYSVESTNRVKRDYRDASFPSTCVNCASFPNIPNTKFTIDRALNNFVKWQSSLDGINYTDVLNGSTSNFSTTAKTSTYYRALVNNANCSAYSTPAYYITNNNFYVNDNSLTGDIYTTAIGSNSNSGLSSGSPKASISEILNTYTLSPCDTIFVDKGTYIDEVVINSQHSGNNQGFVVICGAGVDVSILNAATNKNNISLNQVDYIKIEKFTLNSTQSSYNNIKLQGAEHNNISGNKLIHSVSSNILIFGDNSKANNNKIYSNVINNSSSNGYGITVQGNADTISIYGNTITMSNNTGLAAIYVTSYYSSSTNFYPAHGAIYQNTISAQNYGVKLYGPDYSISTYSISNNIITINTKSLTEGAGIWLGSVGTSSSDKSLIYGNKIIGGSNGIYFSGYADYVRIYNNYISGSDNGIYVSSSSSDIGEIYFNSFYNSTNNLYFAFSSAAYWKIKNNILYNTNSSVSNACIRIGNTGVTFDACDYNLFFAPSGASVGRLSSTNYTTLATWKNVDHADETPKGDENSIYGNPLYVNPSINNLDLTLSSPAAGSGSSISTVITDIYNTTRLNPPFIGALEFLFSLTVSETQTLTCSNPSVSLIGTTASTGVSYSWQGPTIGTPAGTTPTSSITSVSVAGIYSLTITNANGISISSTVQVIENKTIPNVSTGTYKIISPTSPSATLTGSSSTSGVSYSWTPGGSAPTNSITVVSAVGIYTLSVTNPVNGCVASSTVLVANKLSATATITDYENDSLKGKVSLNILGGIPPFNIAWNGVKYPLPANAYKLLKDSLPSITVDSVKFVNYIDSLRQRTVFNDLLPSTNFAVIYDQTNDSVVLSLSVAQKITSWAATVGVVTSTAAVNSIQAGGVNYFYGPGVTVTQNGVFSAGNTYAALPNLIDLNKTNEISFSIPDNLTTAYIGMFDQNSPLSGSYFDLNQKTMFKFNGDGTFDVIFNSQSILNSTYASGDQFALRTNSALGKISYFKNEVLIAEANIADLNLGSTLLLSKVILGNSGASVAGLKIRLPYVIGPIQIYPFNLCRLINAIYSVNVSADPNPVCLGAQTLLTGGLIDFQKTPITPVTFTWQPGSLVGSPVLSGPILSDQIFTLNVTYSGCNISNSIFVQVISSPPVEIVRNIDPYVDGMEFCNPGVLATNSVSNVLNYEWFKDGVSVSSGPSYNTYVPSGSGNYFVRVTFNNGCTSNSNIISVTLYVPPTISYLGSPFSQYNANIIAVNQTGISPGIYTSTPSGLSINASTGSIQPSLSNPGTYTVIYTANVSNAFCHNTATTTVVILPSCELEVNGLIKGSVCEGDIIQLNAQSSVNVEEYIWLPASGLSCTNCPNPILTVDPAVTEYTVFVKVKSSQNFYCNYKVISINVNPNCNQSSILGCCFSNYGAVVYVNSLNTFVNIYCNLVNELGQFSDGTIKKGEFLNKGIVRVYLDWIHNGKNTLYLTGQGYTDFFGKTQNITGNSSTHFNHLYTTGNGIKTTWLDEYINATLNLTTNELNIQNNMLFMKNPTSVATNTTILGSSIICGGGFVSTQSNGYLSRAIVATSTLPYFFPMGASSSGTSIGRYRPLEISMTNTLSGQDEISVNFMNMPPSLATDNAFSNSSYSNNVSDLSPAVTSINNLYYHKIKQTFAPTAYTSSLSIVSHFPSGDGSYQSLAEWEKDASHNSDWWGSTQGASGSNIPAYSNTYPSFNGLINALTKGQQTFQGQPFILAKTSPYVGTGGFGSDGTVITVSSSGSSPTTTSTTTYTNGTTSTTVTSTSGGVTTSTITSPSGTTTTVTVTSTTTGSITVTSTTTATGGVTSTTSNTTTSTGGVTTSTTSTSTDGTITSTTTNTISSNGGVTTSTTSTTDGTNTSTTTSTTSTSPGGTTTSTTTTTDGSTTSTTTSTTSTSPGGTTTSTISTTDGTSTSTTTNTTTTVGGVTSSTTTVSSSDGTSTSEVCETAFAGLSSTTTCTLTAANGSTTTTTSSTTTSGSGGDGSAGSGFDNPIVTGGNTGLTSPTTPGDYEITITPADDCELPGKIKFTVNNDLTISKSSVKYASIGSSNYELLSEDLYTIDNVNSGLLLHSTPQSILKACVNSVTVSTSSGNDFVLDKSIPSPYETLTVFIPVAPDNVFHNFELYDLSGTLVSSTVLTQGNTNVITISGFPSAITNGVYNFKMDVDFINPSNPSLSQTIKGQLIIK